MCATAESVSTFNRVEIGINYYVQSKNVIFQYIRRQKQRKLTISIQVRLRFVFMLI